MGEFSRRSAKYNGHGFTLVEMLVVISIVAILISILIPALASARESAKATVTRSNIRQAATAIGLYTDAHRSTFPWRQESDPIPLDVPGPDGDADHTVTVPHFNLFFYWHGMMHRVTPWPEHYRSWLAAGVRTGEVPWHKPDSDGHLLPSFELSQSFLARPDVWRADAIETDDLYRPVRVADILAPSSKVMMITKRSALPPLRSDDDPKTIMAFADTSVRDLRAEDATPPVAPAWKTPNPLPLHDTPDGVRGVDY